MKQLDDALVIHALFLREKTFHIKAQLCDLARNFDNIKKKSFHIFNVFIGFSETKLSLSYHKVFLDVYFNQNCMLRVTVRSYLEVVKIENKTFKYCR